MISVIEKPVTPVKTGVRKNLKRSAVADFCGNDEKREFRTFYETVKIVSALKIS
jgi:hypothetical protein